MQTASLYYSSKFGQTRKIAGAIRRGLESHGWRVREVNVAEDTEARLDPSDDVVILGAPLYARRYPRSFRRFVQRHLYELKGKRVGFFSVSLTATPGTRESIWESVQPVRSLFEALDWTPVWLASFAGALNYREYSPLVRRVMAGITRKAGGPTDTTRDFEFTNWDQVSKFVTEVAEGREQGEFSTSHIALATRRLDELMPRFDQRMIDEVRIAAPRESVRRAFETLGPEDMPLAEFLARVRTLGQKRPEERDARFFESADRFGVTRLHHGEDEIIGGLIGKFWERGFGIHRSASPEEFRSFSDPNHTKVVSNFWIGELPGGEGSILRTETRIQSLGPDARRKFRWYWTLLGPGIRLYMRSMLNGVRRSAMREETKRAA